MCSDGKVKILNVGNGLYINPANIQFFNVIENKDDSASVAFLFGKDHWVRVNFKNIIGANKWINDFFDCTDIETSNDVIAVKPEEVKIKTNLEFPASKKD